MARTKKKKEKSRGFFEKVFIDPYWNRGVGAQTQGQPAQSFSMDPAQMMAQMLASKYLQSILPWQGLQREGPKEEPSRYKVGPLIAGFQSGKKKEKETRYEGPWYGPGYTETEDKYLPSAIYDEPRYMLPLQMAASPFVGAELLARKIASAFQPSYEKPPPEFATAVQAGQPAQPAQQAPPAPQVPQAQVAPTATGPRIPTGEEAEFTFGRPPTPAMTPTAPTVPEDKIRQGLVSGEIPIGMSYDPERGGFGIVPSPLPPTLAPEEQAKRLKDLADNPLGFMSRLELNMGRKGFKEDKRTMHRHNLARLMEQAGLDPGISGSYATEGLSRRVVDAMSEATGRKETGQRQLEQILLRAQLSATLGEANNPRFDTVLENLTQHAGERKGTLGFAIIGRNGAVEFVDLAGGRGMFRKRATDAWKKGKLKPEQFFTYDLRMPGGWPRDGYGPTRAVSGQVQLIEPMGTKGAAPGGGEASKEMGDTLQKLKMLGPK